MVNLLISRPLQDQSDRRGEPLPVCLFTLQVLFSGLRQGIIFGAPVILGLAPLGGDPVLLFQPVQRGVERALIDLQHVFRDLPDALRDGPAVHRFKSDGLAGILEDRPRSGRPKEIPEERETAIVEATMHTTPKDATHWSIRSMAASQKPAKIQMNRKPTTPAPRNRPFQRTASRL